jgi:hypothetical protein
MALVVEDGTLVANANSFVTRAEIIAYAAARGVTLEDDASTDVLGIKAMDYLWTLCLKGTLVEDATTPYPRTGLVTGDTAEDYVHSIPNSIKQAQLQLALDVHNGVDLTPSGNPVEGAITRSKVGPIEDEFFAPGTLTLDGSAPLTVAMSWLAPHLCSTGIKLGVLRA